MRRKSFTGVEVGETVYFLSRTLKKVRRGRVSDSGYG